MNRRRATWGVILALWLAVLGIAAARCGEGEPYDSGIEGIVTIGPMCPVVHVDTPCPDRPFQAEILILNEEGKKVARAESDEDGRFRVGLPPGRYVIVPQSPNPGAPPQAPEQPVEVRPDEYTQVTIQYDSGIR